MDETQGWLAALPSVFTYSDARQAGLSEYALYSLRDRGEIEVLSRGLYAQPGTIADPDLLEVALRAPDAVLCLGTALARHGLSDEIPRLIDVAVPRGRRLPTTTAPVRWHRFDPATYEIGRERLMVSDHALGIYSAERSICDAFRLRSREGSDQAITALKRWLADRGTQPSKLLRMARRFGPRAEAPIRSALEVLL